MKLTAMPMKRVGRVGGRGGSFQKDMVQSWKADNVNYADNYV